MDLCLMEIFLKKATFDDFNKILYHIWRVEIYSPF